MPRRIILLGLLLTFVMSATAGLADDLAPPGLRGKSVVASWSEAWTSRVISTGHVGTGHVRSRAQFYFGSSGTIFARRFLDQNFGARKSFRVDSVRMESSGNINAFSQILFAGNTMNAARMVGNNDALRLTIVFSGSFNACSGRLQYAKASQQSSYRAPEDGKMKEVLSVSFGSVQCAIKSGNVFGTDPS